MDIQKFVTIQANGGFSKKEIHANALSQGYTAEEATNALSVLDLLPSASSNTESEGSVSTKSILMGVLFLVVMVARFARFSDGGGSNIFLLLGVCTAIGMAVYFFTKKN